MEALGINWKPEYRLVSNLKKWDKNPRQISDFALNRLKRKILEEGMHQVLTIDIDNTVLSGNQRLQILIEIGVEQVWCMVPERQLTAEERDRVALESNIIEGTWDMPILLEKFDMPMLIDVGFSKMQLGIQSPDAAESNSQHLADCPHCGGKIKLSNRVKKIEKA